MSDRDWLNPPEKLMQISNISGVVPTNFLQTPEQKLKQALLTIGDLAHSLMPGQFMVIQKHRSQDHDDGRMFTAKIYMKTEDKLYE